MLFVSMEFHNQPGRGQIKEARHGIIYFENEQMDNGFEIIDNQKGQEVSLQNTAITEISQLLKDTNTAVCSIGTPPWKTPLEGLDDFLKIYARRPGGNNNGGGSLFHYYALWNIIKSVRPSHIVESGAHRGVGTWFLRQSAGLDIPIIVITPHTPDIYVDKNGRYFTDRKFKDFNKINWHFVNINTTLLFMDDHQSGFRRMQEAYVRGFRHMVFDDNYIPGLYRTR